jgi:CheY-like chemotaxis protein
MRDGLARGFCSVCKRDIYLVPSIDGTGCPVCSSPIVETSGAEPEPESQVGSVLVVDDDEDIRYAVRLLLEGKGYEVVGEASDGIEALALLSRHNPQYLILDHLMPSMGGPGTAMRFREVAPNTRIVAFSGVLEARPDWADVFLAKTGISKLPDVLDELSHSRAK